MYLYFQLKQLGDDNFSNPIYEDVIDEINCKEAAALAEAKAFCDITVNLNIDRVQQVLQTVSRILSEIVCIE